MAQTKYWPWTVAAIFMLAFFYADWMWHAEQRKYNALQRDHDTFVKTVDARLEALKQQLDEQGDALRQSEKTVTELRDKTVADLQNKTVPELRDQITALENRNTQRINTQRTERLGFRDDMVAREGPRILHLGFDEGRLDHHGGNGKGGSWTPEQATGEPDTPTAGDHVTAWASSTQDGQEEWLLLEYAEPVNIASVKVYETYHPGALSKVTVVNDNGVESPFWAGMDPTPVTAAKGETEVQPAAPVKSKRVKIYLDSMRVPGWNEIDAVGITDGAGKVYWAVKATASSTFGVQNIVEENKPAAIPNPVTAPVPVPNNF